MPGKTVLVPGMTTLRSTKASLFTIIILWLQCSSKLPDLLSENTVLAVTLWDDRAWVVAGGVAEDVVCPNGTSWRDRLESLEAVMEWQSC